MKATAMSRRFAGSHLSVSYSTRGAFVPVWMAQHVASLAGMDGIDVDATSAVSAWMASRGGSRLAADIPIRSVWTSVDGVKGARLRRIIDSSQQSSQEDAPCLIVHLPASIAVRELARIHSFLRENSPTPNFAIGLPPPSLKGGRPHLVLLGAIRRFAEEWELDVAIDLAGRFDPTWEAEAAVARLGDRLRVIRLTGSASARSAVGRDRVACRALHAALDRERPLEIAVASAGPVPFPITPRAAAASAARAQEYISERAAIHAQALREGISRYEGTPSSRGG